MNRVPLVDLMIVTLLLGVSCFSCTWKKAQIKADLPIALCSTSSVDSLTINKKRLFIRQKFNPKSWSDHKDILIVQITEVQNPDLEPMTFKVSIELPNETIELGAFSLFPPDEPGIFRFRISDHISQIQKWANCSTIVKLIPQPDQSISQKVKIRFNAITWE